jgi:hypothetical protein
MTKYATGFGSAGALTGTEVLQVVRSGADLQAPVSAFATPGYIDGLFMRWVSSTALTVTSGAAYIPSLGYALRSTSDIAKTALSLTASTTYHVYLFLNGSSADIEIVTTAPSSAYNGTSRTKTSDTTRRYIGSVLTDSSGGIYNFAQNGSSIFYKSVGSNFIVLNNGTATTSTNFSCASFMPVSANAAKIKVQNNGSTGTIIYITPGDVTASGANAVVALSNITGSFSINYADIATDSARTLNYITVNAGPAAFVTIVGYYYER